MPQLNIVRAFTLLLDDGETKVAFKPGLQEVDQTYAAHWYVRENLAPEGDATAPAGEGGAPAPAHDMILRADADVELDGVRRAHEITSGQLDEAMRTVATLVEERDRLSDEVKALRAEIAALRAAPPVSPPLGDAPALVARHRGGGSYSVMNGEVEVVQSLSKAEAEAFNAAEPEAKSAFVASRKA
ncbi:STY1053 family phage-associated protein [Salinarimonas soli]|uniref:Uncharacterized protein n=1 Tax=Salinarimonas soli TaxID=1638099 RepID=A0A5B2VHM0_9HYPH|nr:hypothetical protein [Salinarimonas soli]KAA2237677.1 hypothetical protein F0L46_08325 [Salinarimonas soli]